MQKKKIILFGNDRALKSARALEIKGLLDELGHEVLVLPRPALLKSLTDWKNLPFDWAILIVEANAAPPPIAPWTEVFKLMRHPPFFASCSQEELLKSYTTELQCEFTFTKNDPSKDILKTLGLRENTQIASDHYLVEGDLKLSELSEKLFDEKQSGINTAAFLEDPASSGSQGAFNSQGSFKVESSPDEPVFKIENVENSAISKIQGDNDEPPQFKDVKKDSSSAQISKAEDIDDIFGTADNTFIRDMKSDMAADSQNAKKKDESASVESEVSLAEELNLSLSGALEESPPKKEETPKAPKKSLTEKASKLFDDISQGVSKITSGESLSQQSASASSSSSSSQSASSSKPITKIKDVPIKEPLEESVLFTNSKRYIEERDTDTEDIKTIKRYAALKEREAREKQASLVALRKEYDKLFEKLKKSDEERRRLQMTSDELELQIRTSNDKKDEVQHQWSRMETQMQENIKELQIRLDSAQYQASKAEKKLDDFRERVKNDIQKIRTRERELANRLELQKRDAEALLMTKDERLLQQKRDIDRLQFELDSLRERLFEESERSEERVKRLNRVIQSLKLAQGLLSGLEDPMEGSSDPNKGKGEAA